MRTCLPFFGCIDKPGKVVIFVTAAERLIEHLSMTAADAAAIYNPSNMFYLTEGYTGEGAVFISGKRRVIVTDFRYTEQAEKQSPAFEVVMTQRGMSHAQWIAKLCQEEGVSTLRYEDDYLTVKQFEGLRTAVGDKVSYQSINRAPEYLRQFKTEKEIACIREACAITSKAFDMVLPLIHEGMTEKELQIELDLIQLKLGAQCNSFDTIIASGENGSLPHAIPGQRKLQKGDMITMDFGCKAGGYCSDMTRTVALGEPSEQMKHVYEVVLAAQEMAEKAVKPGVTGGELDKIARDYINAQGFEGRFGHGLGHSLGIEIHEDPRAGMASNDVLVPGMLITIEPGIYLPGVGGVRVENTVLVTEDGYEPLTTAPKHLIIL